MLKSFIVRRTADLSIAYLGGKSYSLTLIERARYLRSLLKAAEKIEIGRGGLNYLSIRRYTISLIKLTTSISANGKPNAIKSRNSNTIVSTSLVTKSSLIERV